MKRLLSILGAALLICALPALADPVVPYDHDHGQAPPGAREITEDPVPVTYWTPLGAILKGAIYQNVIELPAPSEPAAIAPLGYVVIDMRPTAFAFNPQFMSPEMPTPIVPKGFGVKIIVPDPPDVDSGCNARQTKACGALCKRGGQKLVSCEVDIQWNEDGTTTRTLICTCYTPGTTPEVAGTSLNTTEFRIAD